MLKKFTYICLIFVILTLALSPITLVNASPNNVVAPWTVYLHAGDSIWFTGNQSPWCPVWKSGCYNPNTLYRLSVSSVSGYYGNCLNYTIEQKFQTFWWKLNSNPISDCVTYQNTPETDVWKPAISISYDYADHLNVTSTIGSGFPKYLYFPIYSVRVPFVTNPSIIAPVGYPAP